MIQPQLKYAAKMTGLLATYVASLLFIMVLQSGTNISPSAWVPGGVALAFILIEGPKYWPAVFLGGVFTGWILGVPFFASLIMGGAGVLSIILGYRLLRSTYVFDTKLSKLREVISFISSAVILSSLIGAMIGSLLLRQIGTISEEQLAPTLFMWFAGQALGTLVTTPFLLSIYNFEWKKTFEDSRWVEGFFICGGLFIMCGLLFAAKADAATTIVATLPYLVFPFIIWGSLRLGMLGTTTMNVIIGAFTLWATSHGYGPFSKGEMIENIFIAQGFLFITSATGLIIAATTAERQRALVETAEALSEREKIKVYGEAIRESEAFLSSVIDNLPNLVFVKDARELRFVRVNRALENLLGVSQKDLIGKNDYDFFPKEQADHFTANDRAVLNLGTLIDIPEELISTRNQGERLLHTRKIPISDPKTGEPIFLLGISDDITETKKAERYRSQLQTEAKAAELASKTKSLFLANMSHEIRTPLGAILGFTNLLRDPNLTAEERESFFEVIQRNGRALSQLIDDILDLSKVEAGRLVIETIETNTRELISDVRSLMELRAQEKGLALRFETPAEIPSAIYTDPNRLRQILVNIIGNAIKFTECGEIRVVVKAEPATAQPSKVVFEVHDTGSGIDPEQSKRLFSWFTQADASTTRKFGGTGLGLALSRRLAHSLGGDVALKSSSANGSCFVISVATHLEGKIAKATSTKLPNVNQVLSEFCDEKLKGLHVLLVDDAADNRALVEKLLQKKHMQVDTAQNGREGVDKALAGKYDLILMDVQMPVLGGIEATEELRKAGVMTPIIALTAGAMKEERERTRRAGCNAHLTKPINFSELYSTLSDLGPS